MNTTHAALARGLQPANALDGSLKAILDQSFNNSQAADYLGISPITLAKWRVFGLSPVFYKLNRRVIYRRSDLDAWLAANRRVSTSDAGAGARA